MPPIERWRDKDVAGLDHSEEERRMFAGRSEVVEKSSDNK